MDLPDVGELFHGRYWIEQELGRGGFAVVFGAVEEHSRRQVALKILEPGPRGYAPDVRARFEREVLIVASLRDPHSVTMFDYGETSDGLLFMVFEFVPGRDLAEILQDGPLPEPVIIHILDQVLQALREAHLHGLLHRDIKPENIRIYEHLGDPFCAKLLDFGIARPTVTGDVRLTREGALIGTPSFMAPEQVIGAELTSRTDLYSLGLVGFEMVTGEVAMDGGGLHEILAKQVSNVPRRLPLDAPVSSELRQFLEQLAAREPEERFATAEDALAALASIRARTPVVRSQSESPPPLGGEGAVAAARSETTVHEPPAAMSWRSLLTIILGVGLGALGAIAALSLLSIGEDDHRGPVADVPQPPERTEEGPRPVIGVEDTASKPIVSSNAVAISHAQRAMQNALIASSGFGAECFRPHDEGLVRFTIDAGEFEAPGGLYVPPGYDGRPAPLVLLFHDSRHNFQPVEEFFRETEIQSVADERGFLVAFFKSQGDAGADSLTLMTSPAWSVRMVNDPLLDQLVTEIRGRTCVDADRIYAIGEGSGGAYALDLRCTMRLAGVATSGFHETPKHAHCTPDEPTPYVAIAGERDRFNPFKARRNCRREQRLTLAERERLWREMNGCSRRAETTRHGQITCETFSGCKAAFVSCTHPAGHGWPSLHYTTTYSHAYSDCVGPPPRDLPMAATIYEHLALRGDDER